MSTVYSTVLLRFGEIGIKSKQTRRRMVSLLVKHVRTALKETKVSFIKVRREYGRIFIETDEAAEAAKVASQVFGIVSASPVVVVSSDMDTILATGGAMAKEQFTKGSTFAVDARRVGTHDYTSQDIRAKLGERILEGLPELNLKVNLTAPEES
ncbi:MAG: THUMP domain-containing protein, partial [Candidatus Thorarchaeota archaeon]